MIARQTRSAVTLGLLVVMPFAMVQACGPDWEPDTFVRKTRPDDLKSFAEGRLGILQTGYDSNELAVAFRYLNGGRLSMKEQQAYAGAAVVEHDWTRMTPEQIESARIAEKVEQPVEQWRTARARYMPRPPLPQPWPTLSGNYGENNYFYYSEGHRCADSAFSTAALTLQSRVVSWGEQSGWLADWVRAQDAVFSNCDGKSPVTPLSAPAGSPALLQADRRYQTAAASFYAGQLEEARAGFEAVAHDDGSPWRYLGEYLAARAVVRKAFAMGPKTDPWSAEVASFDMKTMQEAQTMLEALLKKHDPALKRETIVAELNFVRLRTEPERRVAEICAALAGPRTDENFGQDLSDLNYVLIKQIDPKDEPPLLTWIHVLRSSTGAKDAVDEWDAAHTLPWLVMALIKVRPTDSSVADLLNAAARIKPGEPAYDTVAFHRVRLLTELGRADEARGLLDEILTSLKDDTASSRLNAYRGERMEVARTLDEFLKYAPRTLLDLNSQGAGSLSWVCNASAPQSQTQSRCPAEGRTLKFDEDAAWVLNRQTPLALLVDAARSATLPKGLQQEVALAAWTRSVLLEDADSAEKLSPLLPEQIRKTAGSGIGFPAVLTILRNPGLRPYLEPGISHLTSIGELDHFRNNWWCGDWQGQFEHDPWANGGNGPAAFLSREQRATATAEYAKLRGLPCATVYLGRRVIDFANTHQADPDVPEALALTVRGTRYACTEWGGNSNNATENSTVSKAAFRLLHAKYPKSVWTAKTKYYY